LQTSGQENFHAHEWLKLADWVTKRIKELNDIATNLFEQHQEFVTFARARIQS